MQWDPKSYVAEVLVSGRSGEASETPSYYDYLKVTLERKQNHDALREALDDEQSRTHHIKVHLPGGVITASSFEKYSDDEAEEFESFVNRCAQQLRETQAISDHVGDSLSLFLLQRAEEFFAGKRAFEESLIQLGNFYFSLRGAPKYLYPLEAAPIPGDSEPYITKIISIAGRCLWHRIFSIQDQSVTVVSLAIEGDCARIVAETADECTRLNSYAEVEAYLSKSRSEGKIHNFFLQNSGGSETNSFEDDVPEEQVTSNTNTPENLFNFQAHLFQAVKTGNTADAFHQLENKHNQAIYTDTINLCNRLPQAETAITVLSRSGDLLAQKPTGFQRLGGLLFSFSIPSYSPLYNYVLESGTPLLFNFVEPGVLEKKSSWWVSSQSDESKMWKSTTLKIAKEFSTATHSIFVTKSSYKIGDCAFVVGEFVDFFAAPDAVFHAPGMPQCGASLALGIATLVHKHFGLSGFVFYSCNLASHFPPTLALCTKYHNIGVPICEDLIDPTFTLYYAREVFGAPTDPNEAVDHLPIAASRLSDLPDHQISASARCRLIRIIPVEEADCAVILLSVTHINNFSNPIQFFSFCSRNEHM